MMALCFCRLEIYFSHPSGSKSKDENQPYTQATYDAATGNRTQATLAGGECSHYRTIPAQKRPRTNGSFLFKITPLVC